MINIGDVNLIDLLPPNLARDMEVQAIAAAIDKELKAVNESISECILLPRLDQLPEAVVDHLAWERHVDFYEPDLPIEQKREMVRQSKLWHRRKGTPSAVEELITAIFGDGVVQEWFEYGGAPFYFKVITYNLSVTQEQADRFVSALDTVKNKRSWLESVEVTLSENMDLYLAGVVYQGDNLEIRQVV